jgi:trk system potassium uptake protein TrkH
VLDLRPVLFICGVILTILAALMCIPAAVDLATENPGWRGFLRSAAVTVFVGVALMLVTRAEKIRLNLRQAFAFTTLSWLLVAAFAALPFVFAGRGLSVTDAFFESMSGITTTGSTVITALDKAAPGLLLWRAMLQWLGGIGIIVFALAFLPMLKVGGMQLFRTEAFDTPEKVLPRAAQLAGGIGAIYIGFTVVIVAALWLAGMSGFDALCHAMTSISTGGFSNRDASIGAYTEPAIHWILVVAMIAGCLPFVFYIDAVRGKLRPLVQDSQVRTFLTVLGIAVLTVFAWLWAVRDEPGVAALQKAAFNVTSVMTGTGYASDNYDLWGGFPVVMMFALMFVGGCAGSTTCSVKIFRYQVAYAVGKAQISRLMQPHGVFIPYYNRRPITDEVAASVMGFFLFFVLTFGAVALALGAAGLDTITSLSAAATAVANVGPGFGPVIGPAGNFTSLDDTAKWIMSAGMLIGRLEVFTVFILLAPSFWRS